MAVRVFSRIFDPAAPNEQNIQRIERFLNDIENEKAAKLQNFKEMGLSIGEDDLPPREEGPGRKREGDEANNIPPQQQVDAFISGIGAHLQAGTPAENIFQMVKKANPKLSDDVVRQYIRKAQMNAKGQ